MTSTSYKYFIVAGLLLIALFLTTHRIKEQGTYDEDALLYYTAARTDIAVAKWILSDKSYSLHDYLESKRIHPRANYYGKPLYHFLSILSLLAFGDYDYSLQIMNALFGVITIFVVFKIGEYLYGTRAGVLGALFCLLSPLFLWLSRTNMAHMPQFFFFFSGLYFYLRARGPEGPAHGRMLLSGVFMALSILTHPSAIVWFGLTLLFEMYVCVLKEKKYILFVKRAALFIVPFIIFAIGTNAILSFFKVAMGAEGLKAYIGSGGIYMNYFDQFAFNSRATVAYSDVGGVGLGHTTALETASRKTKLLDALKSYLYDPWVYEGTLRLLTMVAAYIWLLKELATQSNMLLLILIGVPFLFFVLPISNPSIRTILTIFPLLAIVTGGSIDRAVSMGKHKIVVGCLMGLIYIYSAFNIIPIYSVYTGFRNVADRLKEKGVRSILTPDIHMQVDPYMDIYGVKTVVLKDPEAIEKFMDIKYTVIAIRNSFFDPLKEDRHLKYAREVIANKKPLIKEYHIPSLTAMDMHRRENSFIVNKLIQLFLGKSYRRHPIDIYLYETKGLIGDDDITAIKRAN